MKVGIVYSINMTLHEAGYPHDENPERIKVIYNNVKDLDVVEVPARDATVEEISRAHKLHYMTQFSELSKKSSDMYWNEWSLGAIIMAAGSCCQLVQESNKGSINHGFAIIRPPGHHASRGRCSGFCFLNNVMIAALDALEQVHRVLIIDWDVHYHQGTEDIVENTEYDADRLTVFSMHRYDRGNFFPGGKSGRTGTKHNGKIVNVGFNGVCGDKEYTRTLQTFLDNYVHKIGTPDLILVSCGFDAAEGDPLGGYKVTPQGYADMTKQLLKVSPRVVMALEGGYNLEVIPKCARACIQTMIEKK
jgi:acetoin utilization deacetylase AcuC-like enzyme